MLFRFSGYTIRSLDISNDRIPTLVIFRDYASIKDFTLHFVRKTTLIFMCVITVSDTIT